MATASIFNAKKILIGSPSELLGLENECKDSVKLIMDRRPSWCFSPMCCNGNHLSLLLRLNNRLSRECSVLIYAHSANTNGDWHPLAQHLSSVARLAAELAGRAAWAEEARLAGLLHDLGKYADRFQARLHGKDSGLDHWSQGASLALTEFRAIAAALAIEGHHIGLQRGNPIGLKRLRPDCLAAALPPGRSLSDPDLKRLRSRATDDGLTFGKLNSLAVSPKSFERAVAAMLDERLLFSCLVDADFLDTEAHFEGDALGKRPRPEGLRLDAVAALAALDEHMAGLRTATVARVSISIQI